MSKKHLLEIKEYKFSESIVSEIQDNHFVRNLWPVVYLLSDGVKKEAYVGETTDAISRFKTHLKHNQKKTLTSVRLITSDAFNKSATLDIEANLIKYLAGDGKFKLLNANIGIANHSYYQKEDIYWDIFTTLWTELQEQGLTSSTIDKINNSDLYKYSPYKSLTSEQKYSLIELIRSLLSETATTSLVEGAAGTGKTILAIYLFSILHTEINDLDTQEFDEESYEFLSLVRQLKERYPHPKAALVIPMAGFRKTIQNVFKNVKNLRADMVIGPAEVSRSKYDLIIVDESHRLRKRVNLGAYYGAFDKANKKLGLESESGTELDWILKCSSKQIFFYDSAQSIKPSDVDEEKFSILRNNSKTNNLVLHSQLRARGGNDYVSYVDRLLNNRLGNSDKSFESKEYEFIMFDSLKEMRAELNVMDAKHGLCRLVAGYAWEWKSKNADIHDIEIGGIQLKWNGTDKDWVNSENAFNEVGCIHTTQGYDLNYTGVIFGSEIIFDPATKKIKILAENYYDRNGKQNVRSDEELQAYIINIYKTLMLRGIRGTFVYVCNPELREYFRAHVVTRDGVVDKMLPKEVTKPSTPLGEVLKSILSPYSKKMVGLPLYDSIGCGDATYADPIAQETIDVPESLIRPGAKYFVLRTSGDSMNKKGINNGDLILCQKNYQASSGNIAIVLIGDDATLKEIKYEADGLRLIPHSTNPKHQPYKLVEGDEFKVLGTFVQKIDIDDWS